MTRSMRSSATSSDSGPRPAAHVLVMVKYPSPGAVKTRLASRIGPDAACRLFEAFIRDLAARLTLLGWPVTWAVWPPDARLDALVPGHRCVPQAGRDLGERLERAVHDCLAAAALPVVAIGADAPHLDPARLREAADALRGEVDVVLGPAEDGGYYLIGLRAPSPALFRGIAWGSAGVLAATLERARDAQLRTRLLAPTFDVDDENGLEALRDLVARGAVALPHTAAVLASLPRRGARYS
jgi:uncharacterized protein